MGSKKGRRNEKPAHKVFITEAYELGVYEVTQKFWFEIMCTTPVDQLGILRKALGKPNHQDLRGVGDRHPMYWFPGTKFRFSCLISIPFQHYIYIDYLLKLNGNMLLELVHKLPTLLAITKDSFMNMVGMIKTLLRHNPLA